jgi:hypothetical protein
MRSKNIKEPEREQFNSLDPKDNVEVNSIYYGDEEGISTQIVTNYRYSPRE